VKKIIAIAIAAPVALIACAVGLPLCLLVIVFAIITFIVNTINAVISGMLGVAKDRLNSLTRYLNGYVK
jgi:Mg2+/Co2+ transporter CorB